MKERVDISAELYEDEAVCFIADRHHVSPQTLVLRFLMQNGILSETEEETLTFRLEDNEVEMLRGLANRIGR